MEIHIDISFDVAELKELLDQTETPDEEPESESEDEPPTQSILENITVKKENTEPPPKKDSIAGSI